MTAKLFTIGHSNRELSEFLELLEEQGITAVADVRSHPFSRRYPHFSAEPLKKALRDSGIKYVFLGEELGARRTERECYLGGKATYGLIARTEAFRRGLDRIRVGLTNERIALMCSERDPLTCHRTILVCRHLKQDAEIAHIIGSGQIESNEASELRLLKTVGLHERDLFLNTDELVAEAYDIQGEKIAYQEVDSVAQASAEPN